MWSHCIGAGQVHAVSDGTHSVFDIENSAWSKFETTLSPRLNAAAVHDGAGSIVITGGIIKEGAINTCELLDCASHTVTKLPPMSIARAYHACVLYRGAVTVIGGDRDSTCEMLVEEGCGEGTKQWRPMAALHTSGHWGKLAAVVGDVICVVQPYQSHTQNTVDGRHRFVSRAMETHVYNGETWRTVSFFPYHIYGHMTAVWCVSFNDRLAVFTDDVCSIVLLDPATDEWSVRTLTYPDKGDFKNICPCRAISY